MKPLNADQQYHHEEQIIHSRHKRSSGDILGKIKHVSNYTVKRRKKKIYKDGKASD